MYRFMLSCLVLMLFTMPVQASEDHYDYVADSYADARSVTADCLSCHEKEGGDFMKTAHWLWKGPAPSVVGNEEGALVGKENLMNNY